MIIDCYGNEWTKEDLALSVGVGWKELIDELWLLGEGKDFIVSDVKEKFGWLRIYFYSDIKGLQTKIEDIERKSRVICEFCGSKEDVDLICLGSWLKNLCRACRQKA